MFVININLFLFLIGGIKFLIVFCFENNFIVNLKFLFKFRCYIMVCKFGLLFMRWWIFEMKNFKYVCNFLWFVFNMLLIYF